MTTIGVIGAGFVGGSLATIFAERGFNVYQFDKAGKKSIGTNSQQFISINHMIGVCQSDKMFSGVIFLAVPTPMIANTGECDLSIVKEALSDIAKAANKEIIVVCKSTMPPGSTDGFNKIFERSNIRIIHSPEFLSERTCLEDMRSQDRIVIGGTEPARGRVKAIFQEAFPNVFIAETTGATSEMVKYFTNIHLTARIVLSCELHEICNKLTEQGIPINYDEMMSIASIDRRLGSSHMTVPGHDGIPGARGHCLPKDISAMVYVSEKLGMVKSLVKAIKEKNLTIIPPQHRDWEKMVGRGVSARIVKPGLFPLPKSMQNAVDRAMIFVERSSRPIVNKFIGN